MQFWIADKAYMYNEYEMIYKRHIKQIDANLIIGQDYQVKMVKRESCIGIFRVFATDLLTIFAYIYSL
jgi:hypothetical protein